MRLLNSRRDSYEEIVPKTNQVCVSKSTCQTVVRSLAIVTICVVSLSLVVQLANNQSGEIVLLARGRKGDVVVTIENGQIRGKVLKSRDGRDYLAFLGVPYAQAPIGEFRFEPPKRLEGSWEDVRNTTEFTPQCLQVYYDNVSVHGSEDCLYLNIYTPKPIEELRRRRKRFPVIVYLHGGINNGNASRYGAEYFMDEDVVLVMVHFRLHVLGHLTTGDSVMRGNAGMKDQVMAMQWVQANIAAVGGDKRHVTLYGTSSGAMAASLHLLSPMSTGLFHQIIVQSGTLLNTKDMEMDKGRAFAEELATIVNCTTNDSTTMVACLRTVPSDVLTLATRGLHFSVTIEPPSENPSADTCLPDTPLKLQEAGKFNAVPSIHGLTSGEMLVSAMTYLLSLNESTCIRNVSESSKNQAVIDLMQFEFAQDPEAIAKALRNYYFIPYSLTRDALRQNLTHLLDDRASLHPMAVSVRNQLKSSGQRRKPIFLYYLTKEAKNNSYASAVTKKWGDTTVPFGVPHADDLQFFFPSAKVSRIDQGSKNYEFSKFLIKLWVNFVQTGKPTIDNDPAEWTPLTRSDPVEFNWFELGDNLGMFEPYGVNDRIKMWDAFNITELYI